jgi:predicted RNA-binding Zn ribbon-like protein
MTARLHVRGVAPILALDFANTRLWRGQAEPTETLACAADLFDFLVRTGCHDPSGIDAGRRWADAHPDQAGAAFETALGAREAAYRTLAALAEQHRPDAADIDLLDRVLASLPPRVQVALSVDGPAWAVEAEPTLLSLLAPVIWASADLLTWQDHSRLRRCANDECLWLFLDESRMGNRRWCDMSSCGNRAKARRHYARIRNEG